MFDRRPTTFETDDSLGDNARLFESAVEDSVLGVQPAEPARCLGVPLDPHLVVPPEVLQVVEAVGQLVLEALEALGLRRAKALQLPGHGGVLVPPAVGFCPPLPPLLAGNPPAVTCSSTRCRIASSRFSSRAIDLLIEQCVGDFESTVLLPRLANGLSGD